MDARTEATAPELDASEPPRWAGTVALVTGLFLRWWALGASALTADEQYTGVYASLPAPDVWGAVARDDIHAPLDYVMRIPVAGAHDAWWLRAPSALVASITLVAVWRWAARRGWFGFAVLAVFAVAPYVVLYSRTARMYSLLMAAGTAAFLLADRWRRAPSDGVAVAVGAVVLGALLVDTSGLLLLGGAMLVPAWSGSRSSWVWRGALAAAALVWAAVWLPSLLSQYDSGQQSWIPLTSPDRIASQVGGILTLVYPVSGAVALVVMAVGGWALHVLDRERFVVWVSLTAIPIVVTVIAGLWVPLLLSRTLAVSSFGVFVGLAALTEVGRRRSPATWAASVLLLVVLLLPPLRVALTYEEESAAAVESLRQAAAPGDVLVMSPGSLGHLLMWGFDAPMESRPVAGVGDERVFVHALGPPAPGARVWVLANVNTPWEPEGLEPCDGVDVVEVPDYRLACFVASE